MFLPVGDQMAKKRNPNDATFRNINTLKRKHESLTDRVAVLEQTVKGLRKIMNLMEKNQKDLVKNVYGR